MEKRNALSPLPPTSTPASASISRRSTTRSSSSTSGSRELIRLLAAVGIFVIVIFLLPQLVGGQQQNQQRDDLRLCGGGRGFRDTDGICTCISGRHGANCEYLYCPFGPSWLAVPVLDHVRNMPNAVCSDMGYCDSLSGRCVCREGYEGRACERMSCPTTINIRPTFAPTGAVISTSSQAQAPSIPELQIASIGDLTGTASLLSNDATLANSPPCSGHGRCLTMREAGRKYDGRLLKHAPVTYTNWDADKIQGCVCDRGYMGYDCSLRSCPFGRDPTLQGEEENDAGSGASGVSGVYATETLVLQCQADGGFFSMLILEQYTDPIPHDADPGYLKYALERIYGIGKVTIIISVPENDEDSLPQVCSSSSTGSNLGSIAQTKIIFEDFTGERAVPVFLNRNSSRTRQWPDGGTSLYKNDGNSDGNAPILRMSTEHRLHCAACDPENRDCGGKVYFLYEDSVSSAVNVTQEGAPALVKSAIEGLTDLTDSVSGAKWTNLEVNVTVLNDDLDGTSTDTDKTRICSGTSNNTLVISLFSDYGNLPFLRILDSSTQNTNISFTTNAGKGTLYECSNQGRCDRRSGRCECTSVSAYGEFQIRALSSDGKGNLGNRGDCGYIDRRADSIVGGLSFSASGGISGGEGSNCRFLGVDQCNGHGYCSNSTNSCQCFDGWLGVTCKVKNCPMGKAWFDEPITSTRAHQLAECSNMGICDRAVGICSCRPGYTGSACQIKDCVRDSITGEPCNGHGTCVSMDRFFEMYGYQYGNPLSPRDSPDTAWDAFGWHECVCSAKIVPEPSFRPTNFLPGGTAGGLGGESAVVDLDRPSVGPRAMISGIAATSTPLHGWGNWDCSTRNCPRGSAISSRIRTSLTSSPSAFPSTQTQGVSDIGGPGASLSNHEGGRPEIQRVQCFDSPDNVTSFFQLSFRGEPTARIYANYGMYQIKAAVEWGALIGNVSIAFPNFETDNISTACHPLTNQTYGGFLVQFDTELGRQPLLLDFAGEVNVTVTRFQEGSNDNLECSGSIAGFCDRTTGSCVCNKRYTSSDGTNNPGSIGDCGYYSGESLASDAAQFARAALFSEEL